MIMITKNIGQMRKLWSCWSHVVIDERKAQLFVEFMWIQKSIQYCIPTYFPRFRFPFFEKIDPKKCH